MGKTVVRPFIIQLLAFCHLL